MEIEEKEVNSIILIEECFESIYKIRKSSLNSKKELLKKQIKTNEKNIQRNSIFHNENDKFQSFSNNNNKYDDNKYDDNRRSSNNFESSPINSNTSSISNSRTNSRTNSTSNLTTTSATITKNVNTNPINSKGTPPIATPLTSILHQQQKQDQQPSLQIPQQGEEKSNLNTQSSPQRNFSTSFTSLESQKHDQEATEIFNAFKKEIRHWWISNPTKRLDEDLRGDLADDYTERYLCQRLDPLPSSRIVTNIRKTISHIIEEFATDCKLPEEILEAETGNNKDINDKIINNEIEKLNNERLKIAEEKQKIEEQKKEMQSKAKNKKDLEAKRIKEQYENYMKLKTSLNLTEDNDKKREVELETHLDDIRSLISSIKTNTSTLK